MPRKTQPCKGESQSPVRVNYALTGLAFFYTPLPRPSAWAAEFGPFRANGWHGKAIGQLGMVIGPIGTNDYAHEHEHDFALSRRDNRE